MRYEDLPRSENIEDRRGDDSSGGPGGGGFPMGVGAGGLGIGGMLVLGIIGYVFGIDPRILIGGAQILTGGQHQQQTTSRPTGKTGTPKDAMGDFVAAVLGSADVQ